MAGSETGYNGCEPAALAAVLLEREKGGTVKDGEVESGRTSNTCACGHPESEHSPCNGECYLCARKRYTPAGKAGSGESAFLARLYRTMRSWRKSTSEGEVKR